MSKIRSDHALTANGYGVGEHGSSSHIFKEQKIADGCGIGMKIG
jgi:hypothetical protein